MESLEEIPPFEKKEEKKELDPEAVHKKAIALFGLKEDAGFSDIERYMEDLDKHPNPEAKEIINNEFEKDEYEYILEMAKLERQFGKKKK